MSTRAKYIRDQAPLMLLVQAVRSERGVKLDLDQAIRMAGALYDRLEQVQGAPARREHAPSRPRASVDHVARLSAEQGAAFERFYRAYRCPKGKQRAAARWAEIAPDAALAERIVAAAAADAAVPRLPDATRKWPEGWLSERRWEDVPLPGESTPDPAAERAAQVRELRAERAGLARLAATGDPHIAALLADLDARLEALGVAAEVPRESTHKKRRPPGLRALASLIGAERQEPSAEESQQEHTP